MAPDLLVFVRIGPVKNTVKLGVSALVLGFVLEAATLQRLSLDEMTRKSTAIVRARVTGSYAAPAGRTIYTHYRVQVSDRWKGDGGAALDVVLPGGAAGGVRQTFPGTPVLAAGKEYLLFLWTGKSGLTHVIGLSQGIFELKPGSDGQLTALRGAPTELMVDSAGRPVRESALTMRFSDLRQRVRLALAEGGAR